MSQTLFLILATTLWVIGIYMSSKPFYFLNPLSEAAEKLLGEYWHRPLFGCPYCMPSLHGFVIVFLFHAHYGFFYEWYWYIFQWLFVAAGSHTCVCIVYGLIRIIRSYADFLEQPQTDENE